MGENTLHEQGNTLHRSRQNAQPIREHESGSIGPKQAHAPKQTNLGHAMPHGLRKRDTRTAQISNFGAVGASGRPTDLPGRPTWPMGPTASALTRGSSSLAPKVGSR